MADHDVTFRDAGDGDLRAIIKLLALDPLGATRERFEDPLPAVYGTAFQAIQRDPHNRIVVAEHAGGIVGCLQLTIIPGLTRLAMTRALIEGVRIDDSLRGLGLGRRLFEHAIAIARSEDAGMVQLTTDKSRPEAHRFYESLGFVASHEGMKLVLD